MIRRRLAKLEQALPPARVLERTEEENRILHYELVNALARTGRFPALQERLDGCIHRTAAEILRRAVPPQTDQAREHLAYIEEMWVASGRALPFIRPLLGFEYDAWFLPGLTERRLAVRRRPSVVALIGETETTNAQSPWASAQQGV